MKKCCKVELLRHVEENTSLALLLIPQLSSNMADTANVAGVTVLATAISFAVTPINAATTNSIAH